MNTSAEHLFVEFQPSSHVEFARNGNIFTHDIYASSGALMKRDLDRQTVQVNGENIPMSKNQYRVFTFLADHEGVYVPSQVVVEHTLGSDFITRNSLDLYILRLRKNLQDDAKHSMFIHTRKDRGIRFGDLDPTKFYNPKTGLIEDAQQINMLGGEIYYYPETMAVRVRGNVLELTPKEARLLEALYEDEGTIVATEKLLTVVGRDGVIVKKNVLDVYIHRLRNKIESDPTHPRLIHTDRQLGYRLGFDEEKKNALSVLMARWYSFVTIHN